MRHYPLKENTRATQPRSFRSISKQCGSHRQDWEKGQGVIEFVVVSASIIFFIFMFVNLCYVFLVSEYIDYSVFMSARSLYAGHQAYEGTCTPGQYGSVPTQECYAQMTLNSLLKIDSGGVFGPLVKFRTKSIEAVKAKARYPNPKSADNLVSGVKVEYDVPLFLIPPLGVLKQEDIKRITHVRVVSETYMDHEPSQDGCFERLKGIIEGWFPGTLNNAGDAVLAEAEDNGC